MLGNVLIERSIREAVEIRQGTDRREPLMRIVASVDIDRPASQVWAYVADYGNDPSWRGGVTQMRPSQPGPGQEGVTTRELLRPVGMSFRTDAASTGSSLGACSSGRPGIGRSSCEAPAWWSRPARPAAGSMRWWRVACSARCSRLDRLAAPTAGHRRPGSAQAPAGDLDRQRVRAGGAGHLRVDPGERRESTPAQGH